MAQLNKVLLIGNLTRDPEVRYTPKGSPVAEFGIATNRKWKSESGEEKEDVAFINIVAWGSAGENAGKYLCKGSSVFIEGRLQFDSWEKNGEKRSAIKVVAENIQYLSTKNREERAPSNASTPSEPARHEDDDFPF